MRTRYTLHSSLAQPNWRFPNRENLGFLNALSEVLAAAEKQDPSAFPVLRGAECLFVASDYGGEHKGAYWQTLSFLLSDLSEVAASLPMREEVRRRLLLDGRRMAFKSLGDRVRQNALDSFLEAADQLPGLLVTFAISTAITSLFVNEGRLDPCRLEYEPLRNLPSSVVEKLLRVLSLLGLLVSGLSAPGQDLLWATDEDSIVANPARHRYLVNAMAHVWSHLLPHDLRHVRVATSGQDRGDRSLEDLLAIPDLMSGALPDALAGMLGSKGAPPRGFFLPPPASISRKVRRVMDWLSDNTQVLRRLVVLIDEEPGTRHLRATRLRLHGSNDAL